MAIEYLRDLDGNVLRDMFDQPIGLRGRGQPAHEATAENRQKVQLALILGKDEETIATMLNVSKPTLRKHYFHELRQRAAGRLLMETKALGALVAQAEAGKTAAATALLKRLDKIAQRELAALHAAEAPRAPSVVQGKKESAKEIAAAVRGRLQPPAPPVLTKH